MDLNIARRSAALLRDGCANYDTAADHLDRLITEVEQLEKKNRALFEEKKYEELRVSKAETERDRYKAALEDLLRKAERLADTGFVCCAELVEQLKKEAVRPCRWGAPHKVNGMIVRSLGCKPGESIVWSDQTSCPFCGGNIEPV